MAIARALINQPKLILADEPTGNVDTKTAALILQEIHCHVKDHKATLLIVTHDPQVASIADRVVHMVDGKITAN